MAEHIEREAVCYQLEKQESIDGQPRAIRRARRIVADFPAADVAPVRHGSWIKHENDDTIWCSACGLGLESFVAGAFFRFCPFCGALMDKDGDGE